ncbi:nitroreductase family protein [Clostridium sp. AM58-1XD]|uniref:nitroreductase family protein n=1 Tax=Clostridium sp. AM58-1XD TaxID=2292307 RepID=UPI000E4F3880|nr:nitroreductase family protein [Clostridium sp. AM58-1XD]RGZ00079.1 nitroreductase [Clostridium sp. AM58-1XD]
MLKELVMQCRSYRRFYEDVKIPNEVLRGLIDLTRFTASAANAQALKFRIIDSEDEKEKIFPLIGWAGALPEWDGPEKGERPAAYILICCDLEKGKNKMTDDGIVAQTIMLGAVENGFGGCMIANFKRAETAEALGIDRNQFSPDLLLALGKPKEHVVIVPVGEDGSMKYYRDQEQVHYVPKRKLEDILM